MPSVRRQPVDAETLRHAAVIVEDVRVRGERALREHSERLGDIQPHEPLFLDRSVLGVYGEGLEREDQDVLRRTVERVTRFAVAQRECLVPLETEVPGGRAGHDVSPVERAGCYAPGGRYPLPSSVVMTVATARAAGVGSVWAASPRPTEATLVAAYLSGADGLLRSGGAQAIAALAYGAGPIEPCDAVVGPGNRWVTAAKQLVSGHVAIDMLAGPSELVVLADETADPATVAADLLAQAEHDADALPILITTSRELAERVNDEIEIQLADLPTASTAEEALANGFFVVARDLAEGAELCDRLAPEHLQVHARTHPTFRHYGGLFLGDRAAEVLGDYGAGPNHTLPTGGTARSFGGLSVFTFLRVRTWLEMDDPREVAADAARLGRMEGLEAHARSAERRAG